MLVPACSGDSVLPTIGRTLRFRRSPGMFPPVCRGNGEELRGCAQG